MIKAQLISLTKQLKAIGDASVEQVSAEKIAKRNDEQLIVSAIGELTVAVREISQALSRFQAEPKEIIK